MKIYYNVEVKPRDGEDPEKYIKRFFKKVKKLNIIEEYLDRVAFFKKPSIKKKEKRIKNKFLKGREDKK